MLLPPQQNPRIQEVLLIVSKVDRTLVEASTTQKGHRCLIVSYYLPNGEVVKQWLFPGRGLDAWWEARSKRERPARLDDIAEVCGKGWTLPTAEIAYERDGRFNKVLNTKVGQFSPAVGKFLDDVFEIFGEFEVIKVVS